MLAPCLAVCVTTVARGHTSMKAKHAGVVLHTPTARICGPMLQRTGLTSTTYM